MNSFLCLVGFVCISLLPTQYQSLEDRDAKRSLMFETAMDDEDVDAKSLATTVGGGDMSLLTSPGSTATGATSMEHAFLDSQPQQLIEDILGEIKRYLTLLILSIVSWFGCGTCSN